MGCTYGRMMELCGTCVIQDTHENGLKGKSSTFLYIRRLRCPVKLTEKHNNLQKIETFFGGELGMDFFCKGVEDTF